MKPGCVSLVWLIQLLGAIASSSLTVAPALANPATSVSLQPEARQSNHSEAFIQTPVEDSARTAANVLTSEAASDATPTAIGIQNHSSPVQILTPESDEILQTATGSITVLFPQAQAIELRVNGQQVDPGLIGQSISVPATQSLKQTWYNVKFERGLNTITVHKVGDSTPLVTRQFTQGSRNLKPEAKVSSAAPRIDPNAITIVSPTPNALIDQPATPVTVQFPAGEAIELRVNGRLIDDSQIGRTATNTELQVVRQTWYGVTLAPGTNTITVNRRGEAAVLTTSTAQVRGKPSRIKLSTVERSIPANGISTATVNGLLLDSNGNRSSWDAVITLNTTAGKFVGVDLKPTVPGFQVEAVNGAFSVPLQSGSQAGVLRLHAKSNDLESYAQFEFTTPLRPSPLLTGVASFQVRRRGTDYLGSLRDFLPADQKNNFQVSANAAAFGTVAVGDWLITGAVNSERSLNEDCNGDSSLFRTLGNCNEVLYPVYGDESTSEILTPSTDNGFLRFERTSPVTGAGIDYFQWGDYHTQELNRPSQLFSGIGRELHGFKGNYNLGKLQITGIYGNNVEGFQRDTIAPDGTSGFYFLSRRLLVPGSEEVYLELEELNRPGTVLQRERLIQGQDYDIDYDRGSLLFTSPVLRTDIDQDGNVLVRRIVATYQFESNNQNTDIFGGRLQYNFSRELGQESWVGATYFRENRGEQDFELLGADAQIHFGKDGLFTAEYARSNNSLEFGDRVSGEAIRAEISGTVLDRVQGRAYFRTTDKGFSNNATTSFVAGQTRFGGNVDVKVTKETKLKFSYDQEENFGVAPAPLSVLEELLQPGQTPTPGSPQDNSLKTIRAGIQQKIGRANLGVDWVHRDRNDFITGKSIASDQISSSLTVPLAKKLGFHVYNDLTLSSDSDPLYPSRTTVGLDWQVHPGVTIAWDNTYFSGGALEDDFLSSLGIKGTHTFATDTTLRGEFAALGDGLQAKGYGGRFGIDQGVKIASGLRANFSYEYVFSDRFETAAGRQFSQPFAVGQGASALGLTNGHSFSAGLNYTANPNFQASARVEHRTNSNGTNTVISANALGKITRDLTGLLSFNQASAANQTLSDLGISRDIKLGLAYRNPNNDTFNGLLRYEYRQNPSTIPETLLIGRGTGSEEHLFALEGIYAPSWRWEFYGRAGIRHSRTHLAENLIGSSTIGLAQLRATYRLNYRWDISAEGRWIGQPTTGFNEIGINAEVGYYINPNIRLNAGYALGDIHDRDLGNSRSANGPYFGVTLKLDNSLFKDFGFQDSEARQRQSDLIKKTKEEQKIKKETALKEAQEEKAQKEKTQEEKAIAGSQPQ